MNAFPSPFFQKLILLLVLTNKGYAQRYYPDEYMKHSIIEIVIPDDYVKAGKIKSIVADARKHRPIAKNEYDSLGRITTKTWSGFWVDARGIVTDTYKYENNRIAAVLNGEGKSSYTYYDNGNLKMIENPYQLETFDYDSLGNLKKYDWKEKGTMGRSHNYTFEYNDQKQLIKAYKRKWDDERYDAVLLYKYDEYKRLEKVIIKRTLKPDETIQYVYKYNSTDKTIYDIIYTAEDGVCKKHSYCYDGEGFLRQIIFYDGSNGPGAKMLLKYEFYKK